MAAAIDAGNLAQQISDSGLAVGLGSHQVADIGKQLSAGLKNTYKVAGSVAQAACTTTQAVANVFSSSGSAVHDVTPISKDFANLGKCRCLGLGLSFGVVLIALRFVMYSSL